MWPSGTLYVVSHLRAQREPREHVVAVDRSKNIAYLHLGMDRRSSNDSPLFDAFDVDAELGPWSEPYLHIVHCLW